MKVFVEKEKKGIIMTKTIRLVVPDWQAGDNPVYQLGAKVLSAIAPENSNQKTIKVSVENTELPLVKENGVTAQSAILKTIKNTKKAIETENPDKIITFGGNCLVSQQPISYLNGHYQEKVGVIWIDAHPDISNPNIFYNEHAMTLGNLLHQGDPVIQEEVNHPLRADQIYYAGMQEPTDDEKTVLSKLDINYEVQTNSLLDTEKVTKWIKKNSFEHIYIHLDVDVMDPNPKNFYANYFNNPDLGDIPDNATVGKVQRKSVWNFINKLSYEYDLVGFTIAEYLPWSAKQMLDLMDGNKIFE